MHSNRYLKLNDRTHFAGQDYSHLDFSKISESSPATVLAKSPSPVEDYLETHDENAYYSISELHSCPVNVGQLIDEILRMKDHNFAVMKKQFQVCNATSV